MARREVLGRLALASLALLVAGTPTFGDEAPKPLELATVEGVERFPGTAAERERLAKDGFLVLPRFHRQIFQPYIGGEIPYYVTCDSAHRTYHVLFEEALQAVERNVAARVREALGRLWDVLAAAVPTTPRLRDEGHPLALAHVAVAARLFGRAAAVAPAWEERVAGEVRRIEAAAGRDRSPLFGVEEEYALYRPRGFYAGDAVLEAYFRAMTWLGRRGFRAIDERETLAALVLVRTIERDEALRASWKAVDDLLRSLLGAPDDLAVVDYATAMQRTLAADWSDEALEKRLDGLRKSFAALRDPEISAEVLPSLEAWRDFRRNTKGLRLFPARRTPDAWLFQALNEADPTRELPTGLEVALALGSERAGSHLDAMDERSRKAAANVRARTDDFARRSAGTHYGATLDAAALLFDESSPLLGAGAAPEGAPGTVVFPAPAFRTPAWRDRLLTTGLAGWASLRHAWVLHAKTNVTYLGTTEEPTGVVEPAPRYYAALADLARSFLARAAASGLLRRDPGAVVDRMLPTLEKHARGEEITKEDYARIAEDEAGLPRLWAPDPSRPVTDNEYEDEDDTEEVHADDRPEDDWRARLVARLERLRAWRREGRPLPEAESAWVRSLAGIPAADDLGRFAKLLDRLREIAERELRGEALLEEDEALVRSYGKNSARFLGFHGNSYLSPDQMGLVVDVAANHRLGAVLEVAVGAAMELYVVLPLRGGGHRLHRGGVYSYYEFPSEGPLTDAEWIARVSGLATPALPSWTSSYVARPDVASVASRIAAGEKVEGLDNLHDARIGRALLDYWRTARPKSTEAEFHVAWVLGELAPYGRSELRDEIWALLWPTLLAAKDEQPDEHSVLVGRTTVELGLETVLSRTALPADRPGLIALLRRPPETAGPHARRWIVEVLLGMEEPPTPEEIESVLTDEDARVRRYGVRLLLAPVGWLRGEWRKAPPLEPVVARVVRLLGEETDAGVLADALDRLDDVRPRIRRGSWEGRLLVPKVAGLLFHPGDAVRAEAAKRIATIGEVSHADALVALLAVLHGEAAPAAAEALGEILGKDAGDAALRSRALEALDQAFAGGWTLQWTSLRALSSLGGDEAAKRIALRAADSTLDPKMRGIALDALADVGEAAIPHLFPFVFDEADTRYEGRICDMAAAALDRLHGGRFGWKRAKEGEERQAALERLRAEARRLGHAK